MRIAILGAGKIGESLLAGLRSSDWADIVATSRREERAAELRERYGVEATTSNTDAIKGADVVVLAVKPQDIEALLGEIGHLLTAEQTVLSVAAAITTAAIERHLAPDVPVVRSMPNAPSTVHEGIAGMCAGRHAEREHLDRAGTVLRAVGDVVEVPEEHDGRDHRCLGLGPRLLRAARRGDDRGGHPARPVARDLDEARRPDDARHGASSCATSTCTRSSCARRSPRRAARRSARSASSSRPASAPPS